MTDLYIILSIVGLTIALKVFIKKNYPLYSIIVLPGTILHELSHLIMSFITNGQPTNINIFPRKKIVEDKTYYLLGSVDSSNVTWYNAWLIGLAPLFLFFIAYQTYLSDYDWYFKALVITLLIESGMPSTTDITVAIKYSYAILLSLLLSVFFYYNEIQNFWRTFIL